MESTFVIARAVIADAARRKVIWVVLVFAALLALAVPSLPSYGQGVVSAVYREVTVALMFTATIVVALALAATRIPNEVERRTVFALLARDVRRWHYVVGSWIGMFAVIGLVLAAFTAVSIVVGFVVYDELMVVLLQGALGVWLEAGVVMALTVLMSTRFNPVTTIVGALAFLFVGHSVVGLIAPAEHGSSSAPWWIPSLEIFNVINPVAHGSGYNLVYGLAMLAAFVAWSTLLLAGASALFAGRDL
jgi:ABC-type transport system involved in multi-copper enzyme maturation permease subunit